MVKIPSKSCTSDAGFSLVELMVVVAIIGVLAAMSVGQVQKQIAKSRQSEAKTGLASLYSANQTFRAEYNTYTVDFILMKLEYSGRLRYRYGWGAAPGAMNAAYYAGFGVTIAPSGIFKSAGVGGFCTNFPAQCQSSSETDAGCFFSPSSASQTAYSAHACSEIYAAGMSDEWTIDQNKQLLHTNDGIP